MCVYRGNLKKKSGVGPPSFIWPSLLLFGIGVICLITDTGIMLKLYPLLMNVLLLVAFGMTLIQPPSMIYRFATLQDKSIPQSLGARQVADYCRKVTIVWIGFFVFNGNMAAWTIFSGSDTIWSVYNGGISYILIGTLFAVELIVRKKVQKKIPSAIPLTAFKPASRNPQSVLCYEGTWSEGRYKTWNDFLTETAQLRRYIETINAERWVVYCEDYWLFLLAFTALLQCKKEILLTANISPAYLAEIRGTAGQVPFLTDQAFTGNDRPENTAHIPALLHTDAADAHNAFPVINGDETSIIMFTSGSTGKPKAVRQRLTEFEQDNRFVLSQWGTEFLSRKLCSTVSQQHIYGLLFSILLPFTASVPFRRQRIQIPEEMEKLTDTEYMIITVPAFLKRAVEIENTTELALQSPWIFTSGGVLNRETAEKTAGVFGFWPIEVYGSTETSGIAWRQSDTGPEWTPFDNAQLSVNRDGCLVIRSPYIKDPAGFETADMVDIHADGRFLLKGRIDSVVKIEEKRISLPEMENRIMQSGLASHVCVIPWQDKRQCLAAAIVFNEPGKQQFAGLEKHAINTWWREYLLRYFENLVIPKKWRYPDELPTDAQGKIKRETVKTLFAASPPPPLVLPESRFTDLDSFTLAAKTETSVAVTFSVPAASPYFDGHFPSFSILPAVAQLALVTRLASAYFGTGSAVSEIKRMKFTNFIRPGAPLALLIQKKDNTIAFKIYAPQTETTYSVGTIVLPEEK